MSSLEQKESKKLNQLVSYSNSPLFLVLTWQTNEFRLPFKQKSFNKRKGQRMKGRDQSHYREVPDWEIFMKQELRFGLDLGRLAVLEKRVWADYEQV